MFGVRCLGFGDVGLELRVQEEAMFICSACIIRHVSSPHVLEIIQNYEFGVPGSGLRVRLAWGVGFGVDGLCSPLHTTGCHFIKAGRTFCRAGGEGRRV